MALIFLLINIYNAIREKDQVSVLNELTAISSNFENIDNHVIFASDFNIFFNASLDAKGCTPSLKSRSILIELNETLDLCDT